MFDNSRQKYHTSVDRVIRRPRRWLLLYVLLIVVMGLLFLRLPTSFLPDEDQGMMLIKVQTPPGATVERTEKVLDDVRQYLDANESNLVESTLAIWGFNFAGHGKHSGRLFLPLKDWPTQPGQTDKEQTLHKRTRH